VGVADHAAALPVEGTCRRAAKRAGCLVGNTGVGHVKLLSGSFTHLRISAFAILCFYDFTIL
jgi:hypothetical protein